jgi:hypothetical protein
MIAMVDLGVVACLAVVFACLCIIASALDM